MRPNPILYLLLPVLFVLLWFLTNPRETKRSDADLTATSEEDAPAPDPRTVRRDASEAKAAEEAAPVPSNDDPETIEAIRARLGFQGVAEVSVRDAQGRPVAGIPVIAVPELTWRWASADPERPEKYLENLRQDPSAGLPLTNDLGRARLELLPRQGTLVALAGGDGWIGGGASQFSSGTAERPADVAVTVYRKADLTVRARNDRGETLKLLTLLVEPDPATGMPPRRMGFDEARPRASLTCRGLPTHVPLSVQATVLLERPRILKGSILLEPDRENVLELEL